MSFFVKRIFLFIEARQFPNMVNGGGRIFNLNAGGANINPNAG
jgi:hypothetical protein